MNFDGEWGNQYNKSIEKIMPGYAGFSSLVLAILRCYLNTCSNILVIGAGGGNELMSFSMEGWNITGIDPSRQMLDLAEHRLSRIKPKSTIHLLCDRLENMEAEQRYSAATSILVMHFLPDDGSKGTFLNNVFKNLNEGAVYIHVDLCELSNLHKYNLKRIQLAYLQDTGLFQSTDEAEKFLTNATASVYPSKESRMEELFRKTGFINIQRFYQGLIYVGWMMEKA